MFLPDRCLSKLRQDSPFPLPLGLMAGDVPEPLPTRWGYMLEREIQL